MSVETGSQHPLDVLNKEQKKVMISNFAALGDLFVEKSPGMDDELNEIFYALRSMGIESRFGLFMIQNSEDKNTILNAHTQALEAEITRVFSSLNKIQDPERKKHLNKKVLHLPEIVWNPKESLKDPKGLTSLYKILEGSYDYGQKKEDVVHMMYKTLVELETGGFTLNLDLDGLQNNFSAAQKEFANNLQDQVKTFREGVDKSLQAIHKTLGKKELTAESIIKEAKEFTEEFLGKDFFKKWGGSDNENTPPKK